MYVCMYVYMKSRVHNHAVQEMQVFVIVIIANISVNPVKDYWNI